jgi:hypothetical protein
MFRYVHATPPTLLRNRVGTYGNVEIHCDCSGSIQNDGSFEVRNNKKQTWCWRSAHFPSPEGCRCSDSFKLIQRSALAKRYIAQPHRTLKRSEPFWVHSDEKQSFPISVRNYVMRKIGVILISFRPNVDILMRYARLYSFIGIKLKSSTSKSYLSKNIPT